MCAWDGPWKGNIMLACLFCLSTTCLVTGQCTTQTADYCFHHANEFVTMIVPLFLTQTIFRGQSAVCILHCLENHMILSLPVSLWRTGWAIETSLSLSLSVAINLTLSNQLAKPHLGISLSHRRNSKVCFPSFNVSFCQTENGLKRFSKTVAKIRFKTPFLIS